MQNMTASDPYHLQRFVEAQAPVFDEILSELRSGKKQTHWMWFVFPQLAGLGRSSMAQYYAIASLAEASAYLAHDLLGARLRLCTALVNAIPNRPAAAIFGSPDDIKFHSCVTLFARVATNSAIFDEALARYFSAVPDQATLDLLKS